MSKKTSYTIKPPFPRSDLGKIERDGGRGWRYYLWKKLGHVLYFITWPGIWLVIKITPPRTRVIVEYDGKILLTKDWLGAGKWNLPGGGLHRNEKAHDGAVRELFEETGIVIKPDDLENIPLYNDVSISSANQIFFKTRLHSFQKISLQKYEILEYIWLELDDKDNLNIVKDSKDVLAALYKN